jgi:HK97 family phage major capsid protein
MDKETTPRTRTVTAEEMERRTAEAGRVIASGLELRRELQVPSTVREALRADSDQENRLDLRVALSSDIEVERRGWLGDRWVEILDHSPSSVRKDRMTRGGFPMLDGHRRSHLAGAWEDVRVESDGKIRGTPVFSRSQLGQDVRNDVIDGIRQTTSIGYKVHGARLEEVRVEGDDEQVEVWRVTDWEPLEGSWESIPADVGVGAGRSADGAATPAGITEPPETAPTGQERTVKDTDGAAPTGAKDGGVDVAQITRDAEEKARKRTAEILELCAEHDAQELAADFVGRGLSVGQAAREILRRQAEGLTPTTPPAAQKRVDLSQKEERRYSISAAIRQAAGEEPPGLETEVHNALFEQVGMDSRNAAKDVDPRSSSILVPTVGVNWHRDQDGQVVTRDGLDTGTATKGQEAVFTEYGGFLELLRTRMVTTRMGATFLPGLRGNVAFVRQTGAMTLEWVGENDDSDVSTSDLTLVRVTLSPKTGMGSGFYSRQLLRQNAIGIDSIVEKDLAAVHARGWDLAALFGTGSSNQPTGLWNQSGINSLAIDGAISLAAVVNLETEIFADDADAEGMGYVTTPEIRGQAKQTEMFADSSGRPLWTGMGIEGEMNGYRALASNQVSKDVWTAAAVDGRHGIFFGDWSQMLLGEWGVLELIVDPFSRKKEAVVEVTSFQMVDVQLAQPTAFVRGTGLVPNASAS